MNAGRLKQGASDFPFSALSSYRVADKPDGNTLLTIFQQPVVRATRPSWSHKRFAAEAAEQRLATPLKA
jgi:hypothetical protein